MTYLVGAPQLKVGKTLQLQQNKVVKIMNKSSSKDKITNKSLFLKYKLFKIDDI